MRYSLPGKTTIPTQLDLDLQSEHIKANQFLWINSTSSSTSTRPKQAVTTSLYRNSELYIKANFIDLSDLVSSTWSGDGRILD